MSEKTVAIHQPNYLPWIGYFYKILRSDLFVFLDDVPFSKGSYTNRVQYSASGRAKWLSIPVKTSGNLGQLINQVMPATSWVDSHLGILKSCYSKAQFFSDYYSDLTKILKELEYCNLAQINMELVRYILHKLDIKSEIILSSSLNVGGASTDRLITICQEVQATTYLSGTGATSYEEADKFDLVKIELKKSAFVHPMYSQFGDTFVPGLSIIDMLFHCGPRSQELIHGNQLDG